MYRVTLKTTNSLQPTGTFWQREVLYCGDDSKEAARMYWQSEPEDHYQGYGNSCRETVLECAEVTDVVSDMNWVKAPRD